MKKHCNCHCDYTLYDFLNGRVNDLENKIKVFERLINELAGKDGNYLQRCHCGDENCHSMHLKK